MNDIFDVLNQAASTAGNIAGAVKTATSSPAPAKAAPPVSTAPSYKIYYIIGGVAVALLAAVLVIPRMFKK
jgi:hypothetical protein